MDKHKVYKYGGTKGHAISYCDPYPSCHPCPLTRGAVHYYWGRAGVGGGSVGLGFSHFLASALRFLPAEEDPCLAQQIQVRFLQ